MITRLREDFRSVFGQSWPVWLGGMLYGIINVFMFIYYQPWTTLDGVLNWGDNLFGRFGIGNPDALSPLLRSGSVVNIGVLSGSFIAALLAGQFAIRIGPGRELAKGAVGGLLMGIGAVLVRGCNIGGFFSGASALSLHGFTMAIGLALGAFIGVRYLVWELDRIKPSREGPLLHNPKLQPYLGGVALLLALGGIIAYLQSDYHDRGVILLFGIILGITSQRSRICFVRAFRGPFLDGESSHTRAMLLALVISIIGFAIVKNVMFERVDEFVRPTFWMGSLVGGTVFGFGMLLSGGCGGGTLWRVGEGHVKLMVTLVGYILSAAFFNDFLQTSGLMDKLGSEAFLPDITGSWAWAITILLGIIFVWYLIVRWNEETHRLAAI